jgi:hypothetical protein
MRALFGRSLLLAQGAYFLATGIWPLLHRRSFERVTGPKQDFWLAQTVGVLVTCFGGVLVLAERRRRLTYELRLLAGSSAAALASIDVIFSLRGRISKVYLVDATIEMPFVARCLLALVCLGGAARPFQWKE